MSNFWQNINKPIFALAPMEDVTDTAFRELLIHLSAPEKLNILFTEFTAVEGMNHPIGRKKVSERLIVSTSEREALKQSGIKLVAQIWGKDPELFHSVTKLITEEYNFDGIDINMGCPVKNVVKKGSCSALIDQPSLAQEIILASKEATHIPVSVKTRTGIRQHETERWIEQLCKVQPAAITLHGRTQRMFSEKPADWNQIAIGVKVRDALAPAIPFLGNGDIWSYHQGKEFCDTYGTDGVMIGRGIFHNPWFFDPEKTVFTKKERIETLLKHMLLFEKTWLGKRSFNVLKRFFKIYIQDFENAAALRGKLMTLNDYTSVRELMSDEQKV